MKKSLVISEQDSIAALLENERVVEFFVNKGELLLGDIYTATVENILPGIDAAFVNLGKDKMGFLHANDVPGQGLLKERLVPKQKLLVQITKEPTGHKGPRVSTAISLPGRFLVLVPEERGVSISRRISEARERARLKSVVNLMKPPGVGLIIRTEAKGQGENELFEDFEELWDRWQTIVFESEASIGPVLIYRDQDLLYRVIRDAYSTDINEIIVDNQDGHKRAQEYLQGWAGRQTKVSCHAGAESLLVAKGVDREIEAALSDRVELPSGGHLNIQPTEALTVIDVNSGRFTSSRTQAETVRRTNLEAAQEIPRQLRLRNIGGMVIVDFIDMDSRKDQQQVLEVLQRVLEEDRAKPQIGQLSDLGLVELTRRRQGQSLRELFTASCAHCAGLGVIPILEIGPADNRHVISFKPKEEVSLKGRNVGKRVTRQQGTVLRAATASNGRVLSTLGEPEEDEALMYVPQDILEQMPDELLENKPNRGFSKTADAQYEDETKEMTVGDLIQTEDEELGSAIPKENHASQGQIFNATPHELEGLTSVEALSHNIAAVNEVYHDMRSRAWAKTSETPSDESADMITVQQSNSDEATPVSLDLPGVQSQENEDSTSQGFNPYEAEIDPVTGVYRLKVKGTPQMAGGAEEDADFTAQFESLLGGLQRRNVLETPRYDNSSVPSVDLNSSYGVNASEKENTEPVYPDSWNERNLEQSASSPTEREVDKASEAPSDDSLSLDAQKQHEDNQDRQDNYNEPSYYDRPTEEGGETPRPIVIQESDKEYS